jgi:beta-N-acetylhexosaminidase
MYMLKCLLIILSLPILLTGCGRINPSEQQPAQEPAQTTMSDASAVLPTPSPSPPPPPEPEQAPPSKAEVFLGAMTPEEKIGQLFMVAFRGEGMTAFNSAMADVIDSYKPGGVILFSENVQSKEQVSKLIEELQRHSKTPLFIAVDEEGGRVSRLGGLFGEHIPAAGKTASVDEALERGKKLGQRLKELGFNMNFAPVADINTNPQNTVIGDRAFSGCPETAAAYVSACVKGMKSEGIIPVVKHFPGHGDTYEDSHHGTAVFRHDLMRLTDAEILPFIAGTDAGAAVMTGHITAPFITGDDLPATLSKEIIDGILRGKLDFNGIVITDAMDMRAITKYYPPEAAAISALEAGADIILMPADLNAAYDAVLDALNSGRLSEERINASVLRVLEKKF